MALDDREERRGHVRTKRQFGGTLKAGQEIARKASSDFYCVILLGAGLSWLILCPEEGMHDNKADRNTVAKA